MNQILVTEAARRPSESQRVGLNVNPLDMLAILLAAAALALSSSGAFAQAGVASSEQMQDEAAQDQSSASADDGAEDQDSEDTAGSSESEPAQDSAAAASGDDAAEDDSAATDSDAESDADSGSASAPGDEAAAAPAAEPQAAPPPTPKPKPQPQPAAAPEPEPEEEAVEQGPVADTDCQIAEEGPGRAAAEIMPLAAHSLLLDVVNKGDGYVAVGERGHILTSKDGSEWQQSEVPVRVTLTAVQFADEQTGWAVGHAGTILKTTDGGKSWSIQCFDPELQQPYLDVQMFDQQRGIAVGAYGLMKVTDDGGESWLDFDSPITEEQRHMSDIQVLGDGTLLIAGETGFIAVSNDGGKNWMRKRSPYEGSYFGAVPVGQTGVLLYGLRGNVFYAEDIHAIDKWVPSDDVFIMPTQEEEEGAITITQRDQQVVSDDLGGWQVIDTGTNQSFMDGKQLSDGEVVLVGLNGTVRIGDPTEAADMLGVPKAHNWSYAAVLPENDNRLVIVGQDGVYTLTVER